MTISSDKMDSPPPPLPVKTRRSSHAPVIVSATRHTHTNTPPHVVKIRVNPVEPVPAALAQSTANSNTVRINISATELDEMRGSSPYYFYTSGQSSPSDTLDSGTCSDLDGSTPPPLPKKQGVTVTVNHQRGGSLTSSGAEVESDDDISCDSLNSSELDASSDGKQEESQIEPVIHQEIQHRTSRISISSDTENTRQNSNPEIVRASRVFLTSESESSCRVLSEIPKETSPKTNGNLPNTKTHTTSESSEASEDLHKPLQKTSSNSSSVVEERTYDQREKEPLVASLDPDSFYKFHLNENSFEPEVISARTEDDDYFAGCKNYQEGDLASSTIRSTKGTIRGVKNRVRAGIATFLQMHSNKTWQEKEAGKVVVYTTTMGIVRVTYQRCLKVRQILRTHLVKFEEKDVFMSRETQQEIKERMNSEEILVPQVFIEGQYIGDAELIERLNESGELRRILKPYKSADACTVCQVCGGYRLLPCPVCNGSKKSVHRNHFTTELVALKCMNCDQVGLVKCYAC